MPRVRAAQWMTAVGSTVAMTALWFGRSMPAGALVLDLATGGLVMACGVIATVRVPQSRSGVLLFAVGLTWFFADFATLPGAVGLVASSLTYLHRGFFVHLLLTFPTGRRPGRAGGIVVVLGYGLSLAPVLWGTPPLATGLALGLAAATTVRYLRSPGRYRRSRGVAAWCSAVVAAAVITAAVVRELTATAPMAELTLRFYEVTLMATALALLLRELEEGRRSDEVADLVVEFSAGGGLQNGLAWALGDAGLRLHRVRQADRAPPRLPRASGPGSTERTAVLTTTGTPIAIIEHARGLLSDSQLRAAVDSVVLLDDRNRRLRDDVAARAAEVRAARRRLLDADQDEGLLLDQRLREGAGARLDRIADGLSVLQSRSAHDPSPPLHAARDALEVTRSDLSALALGLSPVALLRRGLAAAVEHVAETAAPLDVDVDVDIEGPTDGVRLTAYFCVSELLTNVVKHARAQRAHVAITAAGSDLVIMVSDDGVGGARTEAGRGLIGLTDRVAAWGGTVEIDSHPGSGTAVRIWLPRSSPRSPP